MHGRHDQDRWFCVSYLTSALSLRLALFQAKELRIPPSILGQVVGSINVKPGYFDIGLNLRVKSTLCLQGYLRSRTATSVGMQRSAWQGDDTLQRVKSQGARWEMSRRAVALVAEYRAAFPALFSALQVVTPALPELSCGMVYYTMQWTVRVW